MSAPTSKIWLITGCSTGLGSALARTVLAHGHKVIASSRNPSKTPDLVNEIKGKAEAIYGRLDVVVNNAGYSIVGAFEALQIENARAQLETNFFGPCRIIQPVLPGRRASKSGTIVNVSSTAGLRALPTFSVYASSKFALEAMSEPLAAEVATFNIRVILVEPGAFRTNFLSQDTINYQPPSRAYKDTPVETMINALQNSDGRQNGDPVKGAERIFEVTVGEGMAKGKKEYLRLPLGSDCIQTVRSKIDRLKENFDEFEKIASSTDVDQ